MSRIAAAVLLSCFSVFALAQHRVTIPEAVAQMRPEPVHRTRIREVVELPFSDLVRESDLIVHGVPTVLRTFLTEDQTALTTDYVITPISVLKQRGTAKTPGPAPIIVRQWGGKMVYDGVPVTVEDSNIPLLQEGTSVILFLRFDSKAQRHAITREIYGAFAVRAGKIEPLVVPALFEQYRGQPVELFVREIQRVR